MFRSIVRLRAFSLPGVLLYSLLGVVLFSPTFPLRAQTGTADRRDPVREKFLKINYIFNRKLYSLAIPEYERFLKEHADFKDVAFVHYALALCHYNLATAPTPPGTGKKTKSGTAREAQPAADTKRRLRKAITHLKEALRTRSFESRVEATHLLGQCLLLIEDYRNAATAFRWVVDKKESGKLVAAATLGLAETLYHQGKYTEATLSYRDFLQKGPDSPADRSRARFYLAMSLYHDAEPASARPNAPGPTQSPLVEALAVFEDLASAPGDPYRDDARYMAALVLAEEGKHERAVDLFRPLYQSGSSAYAERALFGLGSSYFQLGRHEEAVLALQRFAKAFPKSGRLDEALLLQARALLELDRSDLAVEVLQRLKTSNAVGDQASLILARNLSRQGAHGQAATVTREALKSFPESSLREDLELELALCEIAGERYAPAASTLETFRRRYPKSRASDHATYLLAYALHRDGRPSESLAVCRSFRQAHPESDYLPEVLQLEAENGFQVGDHKTAQEAYETFLEHATLAKTLDETSAARTRVRIAQALYQEGDYQKALGVLEKVAPSASAEDVVLLSYHYYVGECAYQLQSYPRAAREFSAYLEQISAARPGARKALEVQTVDARFKVGHCRQLAGDVKGAREAYGVALERDSQSPHRDQIYFELGQLDYAEKNFAAAAEHFGSLLAENPKSTFVPHSLYYLGAIAYDAEDYRGATTYFERVVNDHPKSSVAADAEYQLAISLLAGGDNDRAQAVRRQFHAHHPDDPRLGNILLEEAVAASKAGRPEEALATLTTLDNAGGNEAATIDRPRMLYEMAWCYRKLNQPQEAVDTYERLLRSLAGGSGDTAAARESVPPSDRHFENVVRLELAELEFDRRNYEKAKVLLTPVVSGQDETLESALYRLCWCHHVLGEKKPTVEVFRRFEKAFPQSELYPELALIAAKALLEQNQPGRAGDLFKAIATNFPKGKEADLALVSYGECRLEDRRFKEAKTIFEEAITRYPRSDVTYRARFGLGWANENLGLHEEAMSHYREVIASTSTPTAARAQFQIGQCFVATKDYGRAIVEFLKVPASYQYEDWNAKSLLQVAGCFEALGDREKAEEYYHEVATKFEKREEGKLARERLRKLEID